MRVFKTVVLAFAVGGFVVGCGSKLDEPKKDHYEGVYSFTLGADCADFSFDKSSSNVMSISTLIKADNKHYVMDLISMAVPNPQSRPALRSDDDGGIQFFFGEGLGQMQMRVKPHPIKRDYLLITEWRASAVESSRGDMLAIMLKLMAEDYKTKYSDIKPTPDLTNEALCLRKEPPQR